ncbi:MAG: hypothetical protein IJ479_09160 [Alphaproteobacteria bacterium]|nr:hypothetical protein [Alphaproteobacteria bacterium]
MAQKKEKTEINVTVRVTKPNVTSKLQAQIKKREEAIKASPYACSDIADKVAREISKKQIEDFAAQLRARRKAYVFSEMTAEDEQKMRLTAEEKETLKGILSNVNYCAFPYSIKNILIEGFKYPEQEIRHMVRDFAASEFKQTDSPIIGLDLWIDLLSREYVSDTGFAFLRDHVKLLKKNSGKVLYKYIQNVKDRNHSEESEELYQEVLKLYK